MLNQEAGGRGRWQAPGGGQRAFRLLSAACAPDWGPAPHVATDAAGWPLAVEWPQGKLFSAGYPDVKLDPNAPRRRSSTARTGKAVATHDFEAKA